MSNLVIRTFAPAPGVEFQIRVVMLEGDPWFVAADVCRALGLVPNKANGSFQDHLRKLASNERRTLRGHLLNETIGGRGAFPPGGQFTLISESGLYKLIMRSDKPAARAFQDWVTRDVLPTIRRTGSYVMGEEKVATGEVSLEAMVLHVITSLQAKLADYAAAKEALKTQVALMAPTVAMVEEHFADGRLVKLTAAARQLGGVNSNRVHRDLARHGYLYKLAGQNRVYAKHRDVLFVEKFDPVYGTVNLYATKRGIEELTALYRRGALTLKKGAVH